MNFFNYNLSEKQPFSLWASTVHSESYLNQTADIKWYHVKSFCSVPRHVSGSDGSVQWHAGALVYFDPLYPPATPFSFMEVMQEPKLSNLSRPELRLNSDSVLGRSYLDTRTQWWRCWGEAGVKITAPVFPSTTHSWSAPTTPDWSECGAEWKWATWFLNPSMQTMYILPLNSLHCKCFRDHTVAVAQCGKHRLSLINLLLSPEVNWVFSVQQTVIMKLLHNVFFFTSLLHCPHVNLWSVNDWATPHIVAHKLHRFNGKFPNTWLRGKNSSCSTTWFCCSLFFGFQLVSGVFAVFTPQTLRGSVTLLVWGKYVWTAYLRVQKKTNPNCLSSIVYLPTLATLIWCDLITVN